MRNDVTRISNCPWAFENELACQIDENYCHKYREARKGDKAKPYYSGGEKDFGRFVEANIFLRDSANRQVQHQNR